jgi:serine protease Do
MHFLKGVIHMSDKIDDYIKGNEEIESEKIIEGSSEALAEKLPAANGGYYTENYENGNKNRNKPKKKSVKSRTFAVVLSTALITAIIISCVFLAVSPLIMPSLEEFWGVKREVVYVESQPTETDIVFTENTEQIESTVPENEPTHYVIDIGQDDQTVTKIAKVASPSVVGIKVSYDFFSYFYGSQTTNSQGSGIIITSQGYILTNYHVIEEAYSQSSQNPKIEVFLAGDTETSYAASVIGYEKSTDLAVLKIEAEGLLPAQIGDSSRLEIGEMAIAIGNPGGIDLMGSVTSGIISGLNRELSISGTDNTHLIQTDAAINPGNSGGPLLNAKGQVIGINEAKISATGYEGLGFAIPINDAMEAYGRIIANKAADKNLTIGIKIEEKYTKEFADSRGLPYGILVSEVIPTTGAYVAGIKANDIITKFNGVAISNLDEFDTEKNKYEAGDVVDVEIYRIGSGIGEYITVEVEMMSSSDFE